MSSEGKLRLSDGRSLAFVEWGDTGGYPVLGFHGTPNSRLVNVGDEAPQAQGVRLVLPDRPGFGVSDRCAGRRLLDWPADVAVLADALGIERFAVVGVSGGGPYAAACGVMLRDRIVAVGLVSSVGPLAALPTLDAEVTLENAYWLRSTVDLLRRGAEGRLLLAEQCREELRSIRLDPDRWLDDWGHIAPEADRTLLADPRIRRMYVESGFEAAAQGEASYVEELEILLGRDWGFELDGLAVPVFLWHGEDDPTIPVAVAHHLAAMIPNCRARILEGEGHLLVHAHAEEILGALALQFRDR